MKWFNGIATLLVISFVSFPNNIIGCGGGDEGYYYSFFDQNLGYKKIFTPFYYSSYRLLSSEEEPIQTEDVLAQEWSEWSQKKATTKDAHYFINKLSYKDASTIYFHIEKNKPLAVADSIKRNSMTKFFLHDKNLEALGYIMFAKKVQDATYSSNRWESPTYDPALMAKLIKSGTQLYTAAKQDLFKLKYAYQVMRLLFWDNQFSNVETTYNAWVSNNTISSVLQANCLSLYAGALRKLGEKEKAAYLFSKAFDISAAKSVSNYVSFNWSIESNKKPSDYYKYCKTDKEKANMMVLFALQDKLEPKDIETIFMLDKKNKNLELLLSREIQQIESGYFGSYYNGSYINTVNGERQVSEELKKENKALENVFSTIAKDKETGNPAIYNLAAGYLAYLQKDYRKAKEYLNTASGQQPSKAIADQIKLTKIVIAINEKPSIDAAFEAELLPLLEWLYQRGKQPVPGAQDNEWDYRNNWQSFYQNVCNIVLAEKYKGNNPSKHILAVGHAEAYVPESWGSNSLSTLRTGDGKAVNDLFQFFEKKNKTPFETFLIKTNKITANLVVDYAGTAFLREYDYKQAIEWLQKSKEPFVLDKNPFEDLLYDNTERIGKDATFKTTKLEFAKKMLALQQNALSNSKEKAQSLYQMANAFYNTTYYGYTWELVEYGRSGSDGYRLPVKASAFEKEYYGCFKAHQTFKDAMDASTDKNFKAGCLFMMAKCKQKMIEKPSYDYAKYKDNWAAFEKAEEEYFKRFKQNEYFQELVSQYRNTPFFNEAYNSCSYLVQFMDKK